MYSSIIKAIRSIAEEGIEIVGISVVWDGTDSRVHILIEVEEREDILITLDQRIERFKPGTGN